MLKLPELFSLRNKVLCWCTERLLCCRHPMNSIARCSSQDYYYYCARCQSKDFCGLALVSHAVRGAFNSKRRLRNTSLFIHIKFLVILMFAASRDAIYILLRCVGLTYLFNCIQRKRRGLPLCIQHALTLTENVVLTRAGSLMQAAGKWRTRGGSAN